MTTTNDTTTNTPILIPTLRYIHDIRNMQLCSKIINFIITNILIYVYIFSLGLS